MGRELARRLIVVIGCLLLLIACGGGARDGGGDAGDSHHIAERNQMFADEAVERVLDTVQLSCTEIVCPFANSEREDEFRGEIMQKQCTHDCVEVEFDNDVRTYRVVIHWQRFLTECYVEEPHRILFVGETLNLCMPNF